MTIDRVLEIIAGIDKAFALGGDALRYAQQQHPELRDQNLPDAGAEMDQARAEAERRIQAQAEAVRRGVAAGDIDKDKGQP